MSLRRSHRTPIRLCAPQGYFIVLFVIIVTFVGIAAAMQVLVLTSVATTSRAYDSYRQAATEMVRLEHAVNEAVLAEAQVSVARPSQSLTGALTSELGHVSAGGATLQVEQMPNTLPTIAIYPTTTQAPDPIAALSGDVQALLSPELAFLIGPRAAVYPDLTFNFASTRSVLEVARTYRTEICARLFAVPLTRFAVAAYELPAEIGMSTAAKSPGPKSMLPAGLVPSRDPSFIAEWHGPSGTLPYYFRHRATIAAAYQYLFSQSFVDRVADYAGITHYCNLDVVNGTANLSGLTRTGAADSWDLGVAGNGTYDRVSLYKDSSVVFTDQPGRSMRLYDSVGNGEAPALFILMMGPRDSTAGPLAVELNTIARPVVIIGYNISITAAAGTALNGALILDPMSTLNSTGAVTFGHLSYWAGSNRISAGSIVTSPLPSSVEAIAPRVVFVATRATRL